jgi:hypothetical protein
MAQFTSPLNNLKVASPCSQDWEAMTGTERKRFCGECKLNVYNLSGMTKAEAENLIMNSEGRLCVRFYRRADGSVLTQDCPVGWQALKKRISRTAAAFVSLLFGLLGGLGFAAFFKESKKQITMGAIAYRPTPEQTPDNAIMGNIAMPTPKSSPKAQPSPRGFTIGEIAVPTPKPKTTPKSAEHIVGKISVAKN